MNPPIPPRPDYKGNAIRGPPPAPERSSSQHSPGARVSRGSRRGEWGDAPPTRGEGPPPIPTHSVTDPDWEAREELRQQELQEARSRAAQMEKTMRWWSDCTSNWREKWSKVRNERNKARDECRKLHTKLEAALKESHKWKVQKEELLSELAKYKRQSEMGHGAEKERASVCSSGSHKSGCSTDVPESTTTDSAINLTSIEASAQDDFVTKLLSKKDLTLDVENGPSSCKSEEKTMETKKSKTEKVTNDITPTENSINNKQEMDEMQEQLVELKKKLEETCQTMKTQERTKSEIEEKLKTTEFELDEVRSQFDEIRLSHQQTVEELEKVKDNHRIELDRLRVDLQDETTNQTDKDTQLAGLRKELERLQAENAAEWTRREQLESEKLTVERENKRLRCEVEAAMEETERRNKVSPAPTDTDLKTLTQELAVKTKEVYELQHMVSRQKKLLQERSSELDHTTSRTEQYEAEVKKLRGRVEELKRHLAVAEDEVDQQAHQLRKVQRGNDQLQQQVDSLSVQVQHLNTRLRRSSQSMLTSRSSSLKSFESNDTVSESPTVEKTEEV